MIVYGVFPDHANKKIFVTTLNPLDHMSGKVESRIDEFDCTVEKKATHWNPPAVKWFDGDKRKLDKYKDPDVTYIGGEGSYILGPHAAGLLRPIVSDVAELLPIPFQGETWYFMNVCNQIDAVDKTKSRYKIFSSGKVGPVEKIVFSPENIPHAKLFTIPENPRLYYAEHHPDPNPHTFKNIVEQNKLFGIVIEKVWEN